MTDYDENLLDMNDDRGMADVGVEMALLALCMRNEKSVIDVVGKGLEAGDFSDWRNASIYTAIMNLFYEGKSVDRFTVSSTLEKTPDFARMNGLTYIYNVADTVASKSSLNEYVNELRSKSQLRRLDNTLSEIKGMVSKGDKTADYLADHAIAEISKLKSGESTSGVEQLSSILKNAVENITQEINGESGKKVKTGFKRLDNSLGGLHPGSLNILAARPGMGKSALAINIASNVAATGTPVVFFALEMSKIEIANRLLSACMDRPVNEILYSRKMDKRDSAQLENALEKLSGFPIYVDDTAGSNPLSIKSKITGLNSRPESAPGLIIIDYLQLMTMPGKSGSRNEEVSQITRSLKVLAKELNIPIIALSQMSRRAAKDEDHTPQLSDLRDSGSIEQDADTVMFIDRPSYYNKGSDTPKSDDAVETAYIYLEKNRHGSTNRIKVCWIPKKTLFIEQDKNMPEEPSSPYTRTQSSDSASQDHHFEEPAMEPDPNDIPPEPEDSFFDDMNEEFPSGFMSDDDN